jgi:hypothetical protein
MDDQERGDQGDPTALGAQATGREKKMQKRVTHASSIDVVPQPSDWHDGVGEPMDEILVRNKKKLEKMRIQEEVAEELYERLATEFVKTKVEKLNICSRLYLYLQHTFVQQVMFRNDRASLEAVVKQHAKGEIQTLCELEVIMRDEAKELIRQSFDTVGGAGKLINLFEQRKTKSNLLEMTSCRQRIKLKNMPNTWAFTRPESMFFKILETFAYIIISNTKPLIYLSMMLSMFTNAGLISIMYPISIFGFALLEETRPRKQYWTFIRIYTTLILLLKFLFNLSIIDAFQDDFERIDGWIHSGFKNYSSLIYITLYMVPELLILILLMWNDIILRLNGLYYEIEEDIETIQEGIQRNIMKGDQEQINQKKLLRMNMNMEALFRSTEEQRELEQQAKRAEKDQRAQSLNDQRDGGVGEDDDGEEKENRVSEWQSRMMREISERIRRSSQHFDIDRSGNRQKSFFDQLVEQNRLTKGLETDSLFFMEVHKTDYDVEIFESEALATEM